MRKIYFSHYTQVKATVFENVYYFRTRVSAIATHFLQTVFSTVHYMILLCQIPAVFTVAENEKLEAVDGLTNEKNHANIIMY